MKTFAFVMSIIAVMGLAFWAYSENYKTQHALGEVDDLQARIGHLRETRSILKAEWAYLNRPDRLRDLASLNFKALGLVPLSPAQFGRVEQIAYPRPEPELPELPEFPILTGVVDVIATLKAEEELLP